jgi:hypothetical protein
MPFKDTKQGQTHFVGDGCKSPHSPIPDKEKKGTMNDEKNPSTCTHVFEFSHQETLPISSTGANTFYRDVVVCIKCGQTRRYNT